ncbi:MAG: hypothetical protein RIA63_06575, partial [Cyclobacteriaceae bacterium]
NHLGGLDRATFEYNFPGWTMKSQRYHATSAATVTVLEEYEYDHAGRITKMWHTLDGGTRTLLSATNYNELGQVVENNLHSTNNGASFLQSVDYRYNIRGWLTHINNSTLSVDANNDDSNDLFGMQLVYNEETPSVGTNSVVKQYSGNIASVKWKTNNLKDTPQERIYGFHYDSKDRLSKSFYAANNSGAWNGELGMYDEDNLTYDDNGNLNTLRRYAKISGAKAAMDDLSYNAAGTTSTGNKLLTVEDSGNDYLGFADITPGVTEFEFDDNGNLESDLNSAFTTVEYNYINLPSKVLIDEGTSNETSVEFTYDASGYLLKKVYKKAGVVESEYTVDYVNGIQYRGGALAVVFTPQGRATKYNGAWEYEYFLTDHLGNTRVVFGNVHDADVYKATMETYYASDEEDDFKKLSTTRWTDPAYNHTARSTDVPSPDRSAKLNGSVSGLEVGPGLMIPIVSGDKLKMS